MAEYPVMSTSQGTYVRIEQTSEAIRVTYEICRAGGGGDWNWEPLDYTNKSNFLSVRTSTVEQWEEHLVYILLIHFLNMF